MTIIKLGAPTIAYIVTWVFGDINTIFYTLIALIIIDYITGVAKSIYNKQLSSKIGSKGIVRKVMIFVIIAVANIIDNSLNLGEAGIKEVCILFYTSNEFISIIENAIAMDIPLPKALKKLFNSQKKY